MLRMDNYSGASSSSSIYASGSIFGPWRFHPDLSDMLPVMDKITSPFVSRYYGPKERCSLTIEPIIVSRISPGNYSEEIKFSGMFTSFSQSDEECSVAYQINNWNVVYTDGKKVISAICMYFNNSAFIIRQGPDAYTQSLEKYSASEDGQYLTVDIDIILESNSTIKIRKVFKRPSYSGSINQNNPDYRRLVSACALPAFVRAAQSIGWSSPQLRNSAVLGETTIEIEKEVRAVTGSTLSKDATLEDYISMSRRFNGLAQDNEENISVFVIRVSAGDYIWRVGHRYKQFDALRNFIDTKKEMFTSAKKEIASNHNSNNYWELEPPFPGKGLGLGKMSQKQLEERRGMLESYMQYHMSKCGGHGIIPIIDALCAFLEIPNNLYLEQPVVVSQAAPVKSSAMSKLMSISAFGGGGGGSSSKEKDGNLLATPGKNTEGGLASAATPRSSIVGRSSFTTAKAVFKMTPPQLLVLSVIPAINQVEYTEEVCKRPEDVLSAVLRDGFYVIKHGRSGAPKEKILRWVPKDKQHRLFWQDIPKPKEIEAAKQFGTLELSDKSRFIDLDQVLSIRRGDDIDPDHSNESIFSGKKEKLPLFGTPILRRAGFSESQLKLSFSLMMSDRSFDITCKTENDFNFLHYTLEFYLRDQAKRKEQAYKDFVAKETATKKNGGGGK